MTVAQEESTPAEESGGGWFGGQGLLSGAVGKVGGWFGAGAVDEEAKAEQFKKGVEELAERFPDCPADLAGRFLTARGGDKVEESAVMIEKHLAWRAEMLPVSKDDPIVSAELDKGTFRCVGNDTDGRPVLLFAANLNKSSERVVEHVIKMMCYVMEEAIASMPEGMDKFSLILFAPYGTELDLGLVSALASTFQDNYPERLHRLYALPTGMLTRVMWEGVRPFLSANTAAKVVLTSGGHRPRELEKLIPVEVLREAGGAALWLRPWREAMVAMDPQEPDPWAEGYVSPEVSPEPSEASYGGDSDSD